MEMDSDEYTKQQDVSVVIINNEHLPTNDTSGRGQSLMQSCLLLPFIQCQPRNIQATWLCCFFSAGRLRRSVFIQHKSPAVIIQASCQI